MDVCKRCSECLTCKGITRDPGECECIENMYDEELDANEELYVQEEPRKSVA